ncbi:MAG TPA: tRNA (adenosine(37)-N6)-dimethylallyltransferase MiaA [Bacteroidales bacterium]|nr:tRNA (adenosine(37)-N6)-dimethylallyltransferase MiaA [Bacteroidales bacterium]
MQKKGNKRINLIVLLGPTASGKTSVATMLAGMLDSEIISADSRQVYRGMDIGTGKDLDEFVYKGKPVPYHLTDIAEPGEKYNVFEYQRDFYQALEQIHAKGKIPVLCGGTGMYISAILNQYQLLSVPVNPDLRDSLQNKTLDELSDILKSYKPLHNTSDTDTRKRAIRAIEIARYTNEHPDLQKELPELHPMVFGIDISRDARRERITERLYARLNEGMLDEARRLHDSGLSYDDMIYYGLEYKFLALHLKGDLSYDAMVQQLNTAIHQFSKRQMTYFRKMEKDGHRIDWIDFRLSREEKASYILDKINDA